MVRIGFVTRDGMLLNWSGDKPEGMGLWDLYLVKLRKHFEVYFICPVDENSVEADGSLKRPR